ncbi:hypothetical protein HanPSC8_Chr01g0004551 [Helianthus annuus]|nr:hypothetical protein HanPSC8_Chr01g0004551 [Helianthus annuus]
MHYPPISAIFLSAYLLISPHPQTPLQMLSTVGYQFPLLPLCHQPRMCRDQKLAATKHQIINYYICMIKKLYY